MEDIVGVVFSEGCKRFDLFLFSLVFDLVSSSSFFLLLSSFFLLPSSSITRPRAVLAWRLSKVK